jgi:hypothetical protein
MDIAAESSFGSSAGEFGRNGKMQNFSTGCQA